jgi:2-oxoglutarate ferredoxin oxidoreductase subunit gamma
MNILKLFKRSGASLKKIPSNPDRLEIVISGSGGQGVILAGRILAEAAALYDGKEAVMAQSYGPEARGGASRAEIIISEKRIHYPKVMSVDILLAMTQEALDKYGELLVPTGLLMVDETLVKKIPENFKNVFKAPFSVSALKLLGAPIVTNIVALGALVFITQAVSRNALIRTILDLVSKKVLVIDRIAVDTGFKLAQESGFQWKKRRIEA